MRLFPNLMMLCLAASVALAGCGGGEVLQSCTGDDECPTGSSCLDGVCWPKADGGDSSVQWADGAKLTEAGTCASGVTCNNTCCDTGQVCRFNACVPKPGPCTSDKDCINDTYCYNGECIPWGVGPKGSKNNACKHLSPLGLFSPTKQCAWTAPPAGDKYPNHKNVLGTPAVVDFDFDGSSHVCSPSIVFVSYDGIDGGGQASQCASGAYGVIRVIDGKTCHQQYNLDLAKVRASSPVAIGDVDLDGKPDVVAQRCGGGLVAFSHSKSTGKFKLLWTSSPSTTGATSGGWEGPSIHDLDDDGKPEILFGGTVWSNTGKLIDGALGMLIYSAGLIPVAADVDGDGVVELVNGASVWEFKSKKWTLQSTSTANAAGHTAVADFGTFGSNPTADKRSVMDGIAEIVVVSGGTVRVQTIAGRVIFGPVTIPAGGSGGPPTVGDFDNDGRAEVAAASFDSYSVFDPDCAKAGTTAVCASGSTTGVLWSKTSQDHSSSVTGSSIFDFEGDGAAEAVYADECFTRVYDGKTGEVLYSQWRTSCTWYENPIVADVDGDFNSELVVPSNKNCNTDVNCKSNANHHKHPKTGVTLDQLFKGLRCKKAGDCPGGTCSGGYCRCTTDKDCGGTAGGFVCAPPITGTPGSGSVCRAAFSGKVGGIMVYRDVLDRWVNSRMIWNQHAYSVTNINEDGTVPKTSAWKQNWKQKGMNNFRQNVQGSLDPTSSPDLTAGKSTGLSCDKGGNMLLRIKLCNRGLQPVAAGVPVSFYNGQPASKQFICTAKSKAQIDPGKCEVVSCIWNGAPLNTAVDIHVVADDDGTGKGTVTECQEGNNKAVLKGVKCSLIN